MTRKSLNAPRFDNLGKKKVKKPNYVRGGKLGWANRSQESKDRHLKMLSEWHQSRHEKAEILKEMNERVGLDIDEYIY